MKFLQVRDASNVNAVTALALFTSLVLAGCATQSNETLFEARRAHQAELESLKVKLERTTHIESGQIHTGKWDDTWKLYKVDGYFHRNKEFVMTFGKPYDRPPRVLVSLSGLDMGPVLPREHFQAAQVYVPQRWWADIKEITLTNFTLVVRTWHEEMNVFGANFSWIAVPQPE